MGLLSVPRTSEKELEASGRQHGFSIQRLQRITKPILTVRGLWRDIGRALACPSATKLLAAAAEAESLAPPDTKRDKIG